MNTSATNRLLHLAFALTLAIALSLSLSACGNKAQEADHEADATAEAAEASPDDITLTARQLKTVGITMGPLEQRNLGQAVRANGELRLDAQNRASVVPMVSGVVRRVTVAEGQTVTRGQVVAYIESTEIVAMQGDLLTAEQELAAAERELQRQQLLKAERAGVEKNLQAAQAARDVERARVASLKQQLQQFGVAPGSQVQRQIAVTAPISGTVTRITATTGGYASTEASLMELSDNTHAYAALHVFEKDVPLVRAGQHVDIALTYQQDTHISGTVMSVSRTIDPATRSAAVRVGLDSRQTANRLGEGMTVTGMISTGRQQAEALPDEAIVSAGGRKYAYVLVGQEKDAYHFRRVEVVTGQSELGHTAVTFPRRVDDKAQFVRRGAFYLASAMADHGEED